MIGTDAIRTAVQMALVSLASYLIAFYSTSLFHAASAGLGGLWSASSGVVVLQATQRETWSAASLQLLGTAIGSIISAGYLAVLPFSPFGMAGSMFATVLLCHAVAIPGHARLAAINVIVIMVTASLHPTLNPFQNAALRFGESCIGAAIAVFAVLLWPKEPPKPA